MSALHEYIDPSILPMEFGGKQPAMSIDWFTGELYKRHDEFVKNSYFGYEVDGKQPPHADATE